MTIDRFYRSLFVRPGETAPSELRRDSLLVAGVVMVSALVLFGLGHHLRGALFPREGIGPREFLPFHDMTESDKAMFVSSLVRVSPTELENFVSQAGRLITQRMGKQEERSVISNLAQVPSTERENFVRQVQLLMPEHMNGILRVNMLGFLQRIPLAERDRRVERAVRQFALDMPRVRQFGIGTDFLREGRIMLLLETPLDEPLPELDQPMDGGVPAYGINVHHGERDQRTRRALELLRMSTGSMTQHEISLAFTQFNLYLNSFEDAALREKAEFALRGAQKTERDFPPLLGDDTFTICGLRCSGEDLIGRLWSFIEKYVDSRETDPHKERENGKRSIVVALSQCFESDGHRVCNPGKVQRLVVAVLQGRLLGVNVDNVDLSPIDVFGMFLDYPGNRALYRDLDSYNDPLDPSQRQRLNETIEALRAAANRFCNDNPVVDRTQFLNHLEGVLRI